MARARQSRRRHPFRFRTRSSSGKSSRTLLNFEFRLSVKKSPTLPTSPSPPSFYRHLDWRIVNTSQIMQEQSIVPSRVVGISMFASVASVGLPQLTRCADLNQDTGIARNEAAAVWISTGDSPAWSASQHRRRRSCGMGRLEYDSWSLLLLSSSLAQYAAILSSRTRTDSRIAALDLSNPLPAATSLGRWSAEPLRHILLPCSTFIPNAKGYPVLSKNLQAFLKSVFKVGGFFVR